MFKKKHSHHTRKHYKKPIIIALFIGVAFVLGLIIAIITFNILEKNKENYLEVTFVSPRQAIVFWNTESSSIGFVKYGSNAYNMNSTAYQTSSTPSITHGVVIDDVPLEGLYISVHTDKDSPFFWPKKHQIQFDPTIIE